MLRMRRREAAPRLAPGSLSAGLSRPPSRPEPRGKAASVTTPLPGLLGLGLPDDGSAEGPDDYRPPTAAADRVGLETRPESGGLCLSCAVAAVEDWARDPYEYARRGRGLVRQVGKIPAAGERPEYMVFLPLVGGRLGSARSEYKKGAELEATRERRATRLLAERQREMDAAIRALPARLHDVWADSAQPPSRRRRLLFELWDECGERSGRDPPSIAENGEKSRRLIESFIDENLPLGSDQAYTRTELDRLNGSRASRQRFEPYSR